MKYLLTQLKIAFYIWSIVLLGLFAWQKIPTDHLDVQAAPLRPDNLILPPLPPFPVQLDQPSLHLTAKYYASMDTVSGEYLLGQGTQTRYPTASTSKLILAWVVRQHCQPDQKIVISQLFNTGTVVGLQPGQVFSVRDLLLASLIPSANDAAVNLAEGCFGSVSAAVSAMNDQAERWHLGNSHFTNPTGLDQTGNYSSAADLVKLAYLVTKDSLIKEITSTPLTSIASNDGTVISLKNTNKLLGVSNVDGIKTGSTELAGENLIASTSISGHSVITAVLGSSDRFNDTLVLIREIDRVYRWQVESNLYFGPVLGISNSGE